MTVSERAGANSSNSQNLAQVPFAFLQRTLTAVFASVVVASAFIGWNLKGEYLLNAEKGWGYALGIIGGSMMLLLLIYPLRKRLHRNSILIFSTKNWFRIHMMLGVLGPLLVLYHCNFGLGSTNSNIALASMLLMVTSGLIGRFIYGKIHYGLYGSKIQLQELQGHQMLTREHLDGDEHSEIIHISKAVSGKLRSLEQSFKSRKGIVGNLVRVTTLWITTRFSYLLLARSLRKDQESNQHYLNMPKSERKRHLTQVKEHIGAYLLTIRKIAEFSFYERLFSLWHMLHLPIFFMLIITGFVHVYAVHTY